MQMNVEIPADLISQFKEHVAEGEVIKIKKFLVQNAKSAFRVVQANYMIRFTKYTQIDKVVPKPKNFPRFVYNLVPFSELPSHVNSTARFLGMQHIFCDEKICTTFCHVSHIFNKIAIFFSHYRCHWICYCNL